MREDFVVREVSDFQISGGPFAVYQLCKSGIGTPEAIAEILRCWNLPRQTIAYAGLKDRHAVTSQIVTIQNGPRQPLKQRSFELTYLGQAPRHFAAQDIVANHFQITLRGLSPKHAADLLNQLPSLAAGIPNYFDDQRFGSLGTSGQFVAQPWCLGDFERALFLAIAESNVHDKPRERHQKELLRDNWGNWQACKGKLDRSHRRSIVTYLVDHPTDFRRSLALLRSDLRSIYLAAFQSHLWNELAGQVWVHRLGANRIERIPSAAGQLIFAHNLLGTESVEFRSLSIPLPSARQRDWPEPMGRMLNEILQSFSMTLSQLRLKYPRDTFFSKGTRRLLVVPGNLVGKMGDDEVEKHNRCKLSIEFALDRGCYATMLLKWLDHRMEKMKLQT